MKKIIPVILTLIFAGCMLQKYQYDEVRKIPKLNYETPPGCVWLHDNLFMDQTEVTNLNYLEFLYWENRHEPQKYKALLPDTTVWRDSSVLQQPYVEYYFRHPAYRDYPVVGISYEQASAYCQWRTDRVNEFIYIREHRIKSKNYNPDSIYPHPGIMHFRLPTKQEWEYASNAGLDYHYFPLGYESILDKNHWPVSNTLEFRQLSYNTKTNEYYPSGGIVDLNPSDDADLVNPVFAGRQNKYGIYNLLGNVSEIIADTLFKGLNYETALDGSTFKLKKKNYKIVDSTSNGYDYEYSFHYQKPQAWLGFRCVCEVLKTEK